MAGSNMQKAGFCILPRTVQCYLSRSNLAPLHGKATHFRPKEQSSSLTDPSARVFETNEQRNETIRTTNCSYYRR